MTRQVGPDCLLERGSPGRAIEAEVCFFLEDSCLQFAETRPGVPESSRPDLPRVPQEDVESTQSDEIDGPQPLGWVADRVYLRESIGS